MKQYDQADCVMWCTLLYYKQILLWYNNAFQCSTLCYCLSLPPPRTSNTVHLLAQCLSVVIAIRPEFIIASGSMDRGQD